MRRQQYDRPVSDAAPVFEPSMRTTLWLSVRTPPSDAVLEQAAPESTESARRARSGAAISIHLGKTKLKFFKTTRRRAPRSA